MRRAIEAFIRVRELYAAKVDTSGPGSSLLAKIVAAPAVAVAWLIAARLIIEALGLDGYASYAIVAGLILLLPFTDLGMGAAVMDAVARRQETNAADIERVLLTTWRALTVVASVLALTATLMAYGRLWGPALGLGSGTREETAVAVALCIFACNLPLSVGPRMLTGAGLNHYVVWLQALTAFTMLAMVAAVAYAAPRLELFAAAPFAALLISNAIALRIACRRLGLRLLPTVMRAFDRAQAGHSVRKIAAPMLVITLVLPLAYQSDRIILSHFASAAEVASYSLAFQVYSPLVGLVATAGITLWPIFARIRTSHGVTARSFFRWQGIFALGGLSLGTLMLLCAPLAISLASGQSIASSTPLNAAFASLIILQAASYPMAMLLTQPHELSTQAVLHLLMLALNLPLSMWLAVEFGAAGPVAASCVAIVVALFIPQMVMSRRAVTRTYMPTG